MRFTMAKAREVVEKAFSGLNEIKSNNDHLETVANLLGPIAFHTIMMTPIPEKVVKEVQDNFNKLDDQAKEKVQATALGLILAFDTFANVGKIDLSQLMVAATALSLVVGDEDETVMIALFTQNSISLVSAEYFLHPDMERAEAVEWITSLASPEDPKTGETLYDEAFEEAFENLLLRVEAIVQGRIGDEDIQQEED